MNKMDYLKDIYNDFFDNKYSTYNNVIKDNGVDINSIYITDDSKELLNRIISYMKDYFNRPVRQAFFYNS